MIIYYERYVVIQPGIAKTEEGEPINKIGFLNRRRIFKYSGNHSAGKSIS